MSTSLIKDKIPRSKASNPLMRIVLLFEHFLTNLIVPQIVPTDSNFVSLIFSLCNNSAKNSNI
ncbi:hypothetical protein BpHYR1_005259 [Brachionus plicatilis]|uniref:Uncharacterized protein n=1 Tax=Brachionus plicatilis TaxID=10195 RepID=A0A3M7Q2C7_BRAPC|nr:hypothetical protein BpHYR1_005259 [Brachionus plicatilis]